ncbi:hypothetical protein A3A21_03615 [Candidatus Jorgensenbacteria bacterium RIFCSPLOWO2_01_FULL_45_25b]|uniref:SMC-Scp complex subunit ScpB n=1 Tax=Candidatus Jorgensenbacteria bacterium RIFCSPLOWO2_01_FULL_45_25b TaxID=1798471 RepID=A0A1F6BY36_9BACT|nr:MAG: hypothetical protein A3A21_03615 [Candidatus Jorgensenbacteria bacterium RIFCSPLOWO2_01_FULL_45_25b]
MRCVESVKIKEKNEKQQRMNHKQKLPFSAQLEAFLFYHGEAVSVLKIASVLGISEEEVSFGLRELQETLEKDSKRGLTLLWKEKYVPLEAKLRQAPLETKLLMGQVQLVTKPEFAFIFQKLIRGDLEEELTPAALDTLSIVAYLGPLSRAEIDYVRGVNSSFILRNLLLRGLIERREEKKGALYQYEASFDFLKHLGLRKVKDLPEYETYRGMLTRFQEQNKSDSFKPAVS